MDVRKSAGLPADGHSYLREREPVKVTIAPQRRLRAPP